MRTVALCAAAVCLSVYGTPAGDRSAPAEAKLVRYPHYHQGRVAFTYLGDVWTADESGRNVQRLTVNPGRDVYPRWSPDGRSIAFSSDRAGNLDVYIIPADGGTPKQLTVHSADDQVLGWTPDGKGVLFSSQRGEDFMARLYTVSVDGGLPRNAGPDMGMWASYSPDGTRLAINRKGQVYWRKYYRGSMQTDVTVMDLATRKFTDLTDFDGQDSWPMWAADGHIYFVSDRDGNGLTNVWRVPDKGGPAEKVTTFTSGDVRWPSIGTDGKVITFEHDFGIWKLDLASRQARPIPVAIVAETQQSPSEVRDFAGQLDDYDLAPNGRRFAFSIHGEIFTAPVEEGTLVQITDGPARDRDPRYSPDGRWIAYVSDASGREELYVKSADGAGAPRKLTDLDALKLSFAWSPDGSALAYASSDGKLRVHTIASRATRDLATSRYGAVSGVTWSPDGQWIAYARADYARTGDIYLVGAAGGEERRVTFDVYNEGAPRFSPDGRKLYFVRGDAFTDRAGSTASTQIWSVTLVREERDPDGPAGEGEDREASGAAPAPPADTAAPTRPRDGAPGATRRGGTGGGQSGAAAAAPRVSVDWAGLRRRTRQVTRMPFAVTGYAVSGDGRTIAFVTTEPSGTRSVPVVYTVGSDGRRLTRVAAGTPPSDDAPGAGQGPGAGIGDVAVSRDGRTVFFREGQSLYSAPVAGAAAAAPSPGMAAGRAEGRRRIPFTARVRIDRAAEWEEMFDDAWRTMKYRFYDPRMHAMDWDAARAKYRPLVAHVGDRQELLNLVNEMIGELNASHTGAAPPPAGRAGGAATRYLGLELEPDERAGRYRVAHVYEDGPADKDWVRVAAGNYLVAIDGKPVKAGENYWALLQHPLNRTVELTLSGQPGGEGAWRTRVEPVSQQQHNQLRYERWVKERRQMVDRMSDGRVGYVHIQGMNPPSLRRFEKELRENRNKEALVIDERWNGGGNIEQELLALLVQRPYQVWQPRGTEPTERPFAGFFGPKVVLQNWRSASNAEMFPAGFRALGLGKVIGTPTPGAVIGTGSYSLIDGSTVRTPGVGVFLADSARTNMENNGVQPDILVENTPEDNLAGRDRQLETAVQELLKELGARAPRVRANGGR